MQSEICLAVKNAGVYSILADETKDSSKRKQLAIMLRYVDIASVTIFEPMLKLHYSMLKASQNTSLILRRNMV